MTYKLVIKVLITVSLLLYIFYYKVDLNQVIDNVIKIDKKLLFYAYAINLSGILLSTFRWRLILSIQELSIKYIDLLRLYFVSIFYNQFLPGTIGGDAVKIYKISSTSNVKKNEAGSSVIIDRFYGLLTVFVLAWLVFFVNTIWHSIDILFVSLGTLIFYSGLIALILKKELLKRVLFFFVRKIPVINKQTRKILRFHRAIYSFRHKQIAKSQGIYILFSSLSFYLFSYIGLVYMLMYALEQPLSYYSILCFLPIYNLLVMLPISIGGMGVRELLLMYFLSYYGVSGEIAVALGVDILLIRLINSVIGAVIHIKE
jgi:uncharacterized protein (TIRG00374 family)